MKNLKETNENLAVDTSAEVDITTIENVVTKILTKGEEILLKRTPNKKSYLSAAITGAVCGMLVLGIANAFLVYFLLQNGLNTNEVIGLIFTGIFAKNRDPEEKYEKRECFRPAAHRRVPGAVSGPGPGI